MNSLEPYANLFRLDGKVAVVTGSSRGIGRAIAEAMAAHGAKVVISSRKVEPCEGVASDIRAAGGEAIAVTSNVSNRDDLEKLVQTTLEHWGQIDVLVCNAAVNPYFGPLAEIPDEAYDKIMDTDVKNALHLCNLVIPQMAKRGGGAVMIMSSIAAFKGHASLGAYGLAKAANNQLARNLAVEWGGGNVRVNAIAPGLVKTDMAKVLWDDDERLAQTVRSYAVGRIGTPKDIAGAAVFLASDAGKFVTGQCLIVDGGAMIMAGRYS